MPQPAAVLNVVVLANTKGATTGLMRFNSKLAATDAKAQTFSSSLKAMGKTAGLAAGAAGLGALILGTKKAFGEFREAEKVTNQTNAVLKSTGNAAKVTAKEIENLSAKISMKAGIDDEAIQKGQNLLLTFTKIRNEVGAGNQIFNRATQVITDMSVALDQDLKSSAIQVGKALQDPEKGITALRRVGVNFTQTQSDMIKKWVDHGQQLKAQKFILRELTTEFGGSAAAQADSADKLRVAWDNLFERIGKAIGPALEKAMGDLARFINQMQTGKGAGGDFARTMETVGKVLKVGFDILKFWIPLLLRLPKLWFDVGKVAVQVAKRIAEAVRDAFNFVKKITGDVIAGILRRFATLFDVASKLPIIGDKFKGIAEKVRNAADKVDKLGENVRDLPSKKTVKVQVDLLMKDFMAGNVPRLTPLPGGGPSGGPNPFTKPIETAARKKTKKWLLDHIDEIAPLLGAPGTAPGTLGVLEAIGHRMGLVTTSGYRHNDPGWHGKNRARDLADGPGAMMAYAKAIFNRFGSRLLELIYTPMGVGIKNGRPVSIQGFYGPEVAADHYDHVHVAMQRGGKIGGRGSGDKVPALLEPGEFVMNRNATARARPLLEAMNRRIPRFASGGLVARAAQAAGFTGANLLRAVAEAKGESGWNERAVGDGGWSKGLMQIYTRVHGWARGLNLFDPFVNMRAAKRIYDSQGWGAWHADHTPHIAAARAAIASLKGKGGSKGGRGRGPRQGILGGGQNNLTGGVDRTPFGGQGTSGFFDAVQAWAGPRQQAALALASLTPEMADDMAAAQSALDFWKAYLPAAIQSGDPGAINTVVGQIDQWQGTLDGLTTATEEQNALVEAQNELIRQQTAATEAHTQEVAELKAQQKRNEDLIRSQGPALLAGLIQSTNGGIGGNAGLGRQFPSSTGLGGLSRA